MKKATFLVIAVMLLAIVLPVFAQEFPDVPSDHWAYASLQSLVSAGIIQGYPDGTFGGKRAMTRYEFAEALAKAIPAISKQVLAQVPAGGIGPKGEQGIQGIQGIPGPAGITPQQLENITRMANEFRDELAALGVDVDALKRDVAALSDRVSAIEKEMDRVKIYGELNIIGRGTVNNGGVPVDRDSRVLPAGANTANPAAASTVFTDAQFGIKAKASDNVVANVLFGTGNYLNRADGGALAADDFTVWNAYVDAGMKLGPLGATQVVVGRQPFQLTPLTLKFVDPDSYTYVTKTDSGDYILDMARASFKIGGFGLTTFAAKSAPLGTEFTSLMDPNLMLGAGAGLTTAQLAGARLVVGTPFNGNLGLTYLQTGNVSPGRAQIFGADLTASIWKFALSADYGKSDPNDALAAAAVSNGAGTINTANVAWDAGLGYQIGKLGLKGGYTTIERNYFAPGSWSKLGRAVNLRNVKGATASVNYGFGRRLSIGADAMFLEPNTNAAGAAVQGRSSIAQGISVSATGLDKIDYWKAGIKYGLTSSNSVDLGWEQVNWKPLVGGTTREQYINIGLGHSFNANSSLKLLYQIIDYKLGATDPYGTGPGRGGVATAQMQLKY